MPGAQRRLQRLDRDEVRVVSHAGLVERRRPVDRDVAREVAGEHARAERGAPRVGRQLLADRRAQRARARREVQAVAVLVGAVALAHDADGVDRGGHQLALLTQALELLVAAREGVKTLPSASPTMSPRKLIARRLVRPSRRALGLPSVTDPPAATPIALTSLAHGAGCGCKLPAAALLPIVRGLPAVRRAAAARRLEHRRRRRGVQADRRDRARDDDRLLHADRRRPLRLRPDRGGQRAVGRLRDGRRAAGGDERRRVPARVSSAATCCARSCAAARTSPRRPGSRSSAGTRSTIPSRSTGWRSPARCIPTS